MLHFESPYALLLLVLIPALPFLRRYTAGRGAVRFSTIANAARAGLSWRQRLHGLPMAIRLIALLCLVIALARPQTGREEVVDISKGVAIEMVIDRSGSMAAEMEYKGRQMTRLDVVKDVFKNFALGDGRDLQGRPNDLIGIIAFARYADTICPLTLAHGALEPFLDTVKLVQVRSEDGTAIGDALALAAARLEKVEDTLARQQTENKKVYNIKSKIIILLSDGENNAGKRDPLEAAKLAAKWGVKVYAIAIGGGSAMQSIKTPFGVYKVPVGHSVDTTALKQIAEETGGFFREATDAASLSSIYEEIDKMEKSDVESVKYVDYKEAFLPFALVGLMLIVAEVLLSQNRFQKIAIIDMILRNIDMLHFLWFIPVLAGVYAYAVYKRKAGLQRFIDAGLLDRIPVSVSRVRRFWKSAAVLFAVIFLVIAMTRPAWNPKPETIERKGRDVVFLLDVSKSMLAEDLYPNRLERAKLAILDCIDRLEGDRIGLVAFAGTAAVKCPLTLDYGFFRMMLKDISTDSITRGGTMIGDGIRKVMTEVFDDQIKEFKDIILITDGEDHDSFPVEAAKAAGEKGIRIIAIGLGDENEGKRIPITSETGIRTFLKHNGQEVWSRLDADTLREMVNATPGGKYLNVATGAIDLGNVYARLIATADKKALESETIKRYEEKFQIFVAAAFLILSIEMLISERKRIKP